MPAILLIDRGRGTPQADDHDALERLLEESNEGVPIPWLARTLFGDDVTSSDKDWRFVKRHGERYHRVERPTATIAVETAAGEYENRQTDPDLAWIFPTHPTPAEGLLDTASGTSRPAPRSVTNARRMLARRRTLPTARSWGGVIGSFGAKRLGEERASDGPNRTRFNDVARALSGRDRLTTAFTGALVAGHVEGAIVTATTDPSRYANLKDAADTLTRDVDLLRKCLDRPPGITVLEPTADGKPHAHVALLGDPSALPSRHALHNYWHVRRGRGQKVDVVPIAAVATDGGIGRVRPWTWAADARPADADGRDPVTYLSAGPDALATVATIW